MPGRVSIASTILPARRRLITAWPIPTYQGEGESSHMWLYQ